MKLVLFFVLFSLTAMALDHKGECARTALKHALKSRKKAHAEFSLKLKVPDQPVELHSYEIGYYEGDRLIQAEVTVEFIRGKCLSPKLLYTAMVE